MSIENVLYVSWRWFSGMLATMAIIVAAAWGLAQLSAGVGDVVAVDSDPIDPTLRLALGEPIKYGIHWRFVEGGCQSFVVARFSKQEGREETQLYQRRAARPRAVGQPGYELIERPMPMGITPGIWHYRVDIESECPTRKPKPVRFVEFMLDIYDPKAPIVTVQKIEPVQTTLRVGDPLRYRISFTRRLDVPGISTAIYTAEPPSGDPGRPDVIVTQRPIAYSSAGTYRDIDVTQPTPPNLWPGRWRVRIVSTTLWPDGRQPQADPMGEFVIEVSK